MRIAILALLLAAGLGWFAFEQKRGKLKEAEEGFLDFLVANARATLTKNAPEESPDVVLVEFREQEKAEYIAWPPAPLDYIMMLKTLATHDPPVLVIAEPLRWEQTEAEFVTPLREALTRFRWVVLGYHLASDATEATPEQKEFAANDMPELPPAEGEQQHVPKFSRVSKLSDWSLRIASEDGFSSLTGDATAAKKDSVPFIATDGKRLVPSLEAQAVMLFRKSPYAAQRLRFGTGARLSLGDAFIIPLQNDGSLPVSDMPRVPVVNALELMVPDVDDETSNAVRASLGKGKVVVFGNGSNAMLHARAIATALAMPEVRRAPDTVMWSFAGAACLFCLWQLRFRRFGALVAGVAAFVVGLGVCLLVFQSSLLWWPPLAAVLAIAIGTVFCFLWPAKRRGPVAPAPEPVPAAAAAPVSTAPEVPAEKKP
jgi:hypothetical protein